MGKTLDLGRRIEIHPMDKHCHNISLGLYRRDTGDGPRFLVHTYSTASGSQQRVAFLRQTLIDMVGLIPSASDSQWLQFACGQDHLRALKRAFLDLCKLETSSSLQPKPLSALDKKAGCQLTVVSLGKGAYRMVAEQQNDTARKRAAALARGYVKLCEMESLAGEQNAVRFACHADHDALMGMLLYRAQNVRAAMQEEELVGGRGVLAPPSQQ